MENVKLNTIEEAIEDFKAGNFVIVVDDEDRENEGDLIIEFEFFQVQIGIGRDGNVNIFI